MLNYKNIYGEKPTAVPRSEFNNMYDRSQKNKRNRYNETEPAIGVEDCNLNKELLIFAIYINTGTTSRVKSQSLIAELSAQYNQQFSKIEAQTNYLIKLFIFPITEGKTRMECVFGGNNASVSNGKGNIEDALNKLGPLGNIEEAPEPRFGSGDTNNISCTPFDGKWSGHNEISKGSNRYDGPNHAFDSDIFVGDRTERSRSSGKIKEW